MRFLGGKYGLAVVVAIWITVVTPWLAFSQQTPDYDMGDIELLTAEEVGLPPHYWAYLQHSWEWSQLYDPDVALAALSRHALTNDGTAHHAMLVQTLRNQSCEADTTLPARDIVPSSESLQHSEYGSLLAMICFADDDELRSSLQSLLERSEENAAANVLVWSVVLLLDRLASTDRAIEFSEAFIDLTTTQWRSYYLTKFWIRDLYEPQQGLFSGRVRSEFDQYGRSLGSIRQYHRSLLDHRSRSRENYPNTVVRYEDRLRVEAYQNRTKSTISPDHHLYHCAANYRSVEVANTCIQGSVFDHLACSQVVESPVDTARAVYEICRKRYLEFYLSDKE